MSTPIADMLKQMLAANMPHDMIVLAVAAVEITLASVTAASTTMSTGGQVDAKQEQRRLRERLKKAKWRARRKNSTAASSGGQVDASTVPAVDMVDMSTSRPLSLSSSSFKKEKTSEREARAKPSPVDWQPSADEQRFAAERRGWSPADIADVALKFKSYRETGGKRSWESWVIDERRPLRVVHGKYDGKDPLREARAFTEAEWRRKFAFIAGDPKLTWPEKQWGPAPGNPGCLIPEALQRELTANHPTLNRGPNQCTA